MKSFFEELFSAGDGDTIANRKSKEEAVKTLLGTEDVDVSKMKDEELDSFLQKLSTVTTESFDQRASEIISVMRELKASKVDIIKALQVHLGVNLREAREILRDYLIEEAFHADRKHV